MLDPEKPTTISSEYPRPFIISVLRVFALKAKQTGAAGQVALYLEASSPGSSASKVLPLSH